MGNPDKLPSNLLDRQPPKVSNFVQNLALFGASHSTKSKRGDRGVWLAHLLMEHQVAIESQEILLIAYRWQCDEHFVRVACSRHESLLDATGMIKNAKLYGVG